MASDETTKESTEKIFLTPNLPCYDSEKWERVQEAYSAESLTKNFKSKTQLNQAERMELLTRIMSYGSSMVKPKLGGLQVTFSYRTLRIFF